MADDKGIKLSSKEKIISDLFHAVGFGIGSLKGLAISSYENIEEFRTYCKKACQDLEKLSDKIMTEYKEDE